MTRLGLWGRGTYFEDFKAIESVLSAGGGTGAGAMEMLAVQLKSSGAYLARNLGLRGVDFHMPQVRRSLPFRSRSPVAARRVTEWPPPPPRLPRSS